MDLVIGEEYRRRDLHAAFGGQRQGGISTPTKGDVILVFTGESGEQYGYADGPQPDGVFWYTGEGQRGDMRFDKGNRAIRDAEDNGKRLLLFAQTRKGFVRFEGEAMCIDYHEGTGPDLDGKLRKTIVFHLALGDDASNPAVAPKAPDLRVRGEKRSLSKLSLEELRQKALALPPNNATAKQRLQNVWMRSVSVREYVLRRAAGTCESCHEPAPFTRGDGTLYLEPHHIRRLADGGPDHPRWVAAICPTCHRRIHHGKDGDQVNQRLADHIGTVEHD